MTVPFDKLYHYIEYVAQQTNHNDVVISYFDPPGSKNIENFVRLRDQDWFTLNTKPWIFCNDQELLNAEIYKNYFSQSDSIFMQLVKKHKLWHPWLRPANIFDNFILLHSEVNSKEVETYTRNGFIPVFYWSHGLIARDWFRYAQHLDQNKRSQQIFLIYNRAWSGTREYRIKLAELLVHNNLLGQCRTTFNSVDPESGEHYSEHKFVNPLFQPQIDLQQYFVSNQKPGSYSAEFELQDYESTDIEVVLETLFDDSRIHLTEKSLRPMALAQPFILVSSPNSLKYLQDYGFETFDTIWDESYDQISDPVQRLEAIVELMKDISGWDQETKHKKIAKARTIAQKNKQRFFSQEFLNLITGELEQNLSQALESLRAQNTGQLFLQQRKALAAQPELKAIMLGRTDHPDAAHLPEGHIFKQTLVNPDLNVKILAEARKYVAKKQTT